MLTLSIMKKTSQDVISVTLKALAFHLPCPLLLMFVVTKMYQNYDDGKYKVKFQGAFAAVECKISAGENGGIKAERGGMLAMGDHIELAPRLEGTLPMACFRCCCVGEGLGLTHYFIKPESPAGTTDTVMIAPSIPGEVLLLDVAPGQKWNIQKGAYLCSDATVAVGVKIQSLMKALFSGEGLFVIQCSGQGKLVLNTYGTIVPYELKAGEKLKVDNGYLVAWEDSIDYTIAKASKSIFNTIISGEGLVANFTGPGKVYIQTRHLGSLGRVLGPHIRIGAR
eukprot:jgi/Mesvir1/19643/Mv09926-RA.1